MPVLSPADMTELRALDQELSFHDHYDLLRPISGGTDEVGNTLPATDAVYATGLCALNAGGLQSQERVAADRVTSAVAYTVDLPIDTILKGTDRIRINGRVFEVIGDPVDEGFLATHKTATLVEQT